MRAVLIKISTQEIIKKSKYPQLSIEIIPSLDTDLEWLLVNRIDAPSFNSNLEKLVFFEEITTEPHPVYADFNQYKIGYNVVNLTQTEIDEIINQNRETQSSNSFERNINDGRDLFSKSYRRMYRRFKDEDISPNNVLTLSDVKKFMRWNESVYISLSQGSFYQAENRILKVLSDNQTELDGNRPLQKIFEWLRDEIQGYVLNNYDLIITDPNI